MHDIIVVTGTDFGVGKTWVTAALARSLVQRHNEVRALKLSESGVATGPTGTDDGAVLAAATGQDAPTTALYGHPSPDTGIEIANPSIPPDLDAMVTQVRQIAAHGDVTLAEGLGGLLAPLTWECTVVDVARRVGAMAIVVAPDRRGTINHTLLTLRALAEANVNCLGVALNAFGSPDATTGKNAAVLRRLAPGTRVVETSGNGWESRLV